ncbi:hypothetical protein ANANG_G00042810 [Anguilla anguilla]|uniref:PEHE domain-containing protein n=1 Tax=Anguilla anguilla TaxID=7936 RepID=A0A9D3MU36_ANGAN|nr:hypothetical protein ANANG_G00042810 [Anguilla anguilla]
MKTRSCREPFVLSAGRRAPVGCEGEGGDPVPLGLSLFRSWGQTARPVPSPAAPQRVRDRQSCPSVAALQSATSLRARCPAQRSISCLVGAAWFCTEEFVFRKPRTSGFAAVPGRPSAGLTPVSTACLHPVRGQLQPQEHKPWRRAEGRYALERASIVSHWNWLQAHISDLEYRIRQQTDIYRQIRTNKGSLELGDSAPCEAPAEEAPEVKAEAAACQGTQDGGSEGAERAASPPQPRRRGGTLEGQRPRPARQRDDQQPPPRPARPRLVPEPRPGEQAGQKQRLAQPLPSPRRRHLRGRPHAPHPRLQEAEARPARRRRQPRPQGPEDPGAPLRLRRQPPVRHVRRPPPPAPSSRTSSPSWSGCPSWTPACTPSSPSRRRVHGPALPAGDEVALARQAPGEDQAPEEAVAQAQAVARRPPARPLLPVLLQRQTQARQLAPPRAQTLAPQDEAGEAAPGAPGGPLALQGGAAGPGPPPGAYDRGHGRKRPREHYPERTDANPKLCVDAGGPCSPLTGLHTPSHSPLVRQLSTSSEGSTPVGPGSQSATSTPQPIRRRRGESSFDINNIVIPMSVAATTRVEKLQYKEILTPSWREVDIFAKPIAEEDENVEIEDLTDTAFTQLHLPCEEQERSRWTWMASAPAKRRGSRSYKSLDGRTTPLLGGTTPSTPQPAEDTRCSTPDFTAEELTVQPWERRDFPLEEDPALEPAAEQGGPGEGPGRAPAAPPGAGLPRLQDRVGERARLAAPPPAPSNEQRRRRGHLPPNPPNTYWH